MSVLALYPKSPEPSATLATTGPSRPAFSTMVLNGTLHEIQFEFLLLHQHCQL
jgi:hypothetical protein